MNDAAARPLGRPKTVTPSPVRFTTRLAPRGYLRLRLRIYAITSSESVPESINSAFACGLNEETLLERALLSMVGWQCPQT